MWDCALLGVDAGDGRTNDRSGSRVGAGSVLSLEVSVARSAVGSVLVVFSFLLIVEGVWS